MNSRPIRVAWDNSLAGHDRAGTGIYSSQLTRELAGRPELSLEVFRGWERNGTRPSALTRGVHSLGRLLWNHYYFPRLLRKQRFDLLHAPAFVVPFTCPCPTVVTIHDLTFLIFPDHFKRRWRTYLKTTLPAVLRSASAIICVSEHTKQDLLKFYDLPPEKVRVVYNGVDHAQFRPGANFDKDWARMIGIKGDYVLHVGTFSQRKNIPSLLRAVASLRDKGKFENCQLVLAGQEEPRLPGAREVFATIRELELQDITVLTGYLPAEQLPGLYAQAKLLAMPSLYEGFGFPVLESMAVGTPVVASNCSSLAEIGGDAALLVPPQDVDALASAIQDLRENRSAAECLRQKGLKRAAQFSWQRAATETVEVYRSVKRS